MEEDRDVVVEESDEAKELIDNGRSTIVNIDGGEKDISGTNPDFIDKLIEVIEVEGLMMTNDDIFNMVVPLRFDYVQGLGPRTHPTPKPYRVLVQQKRKLRIEL
ncbi:hypothetical protein FNV43_RR10455 [Rhamnella rubrinervis]|uniref:Uncharacterized protein n=1 Tax=Rhamnella rubrinervis TaxID=2594499 RepID=A0A8K0HCN3_9ROSA|nr:hypothetical protein FNV43_RR09606 [Rhamnella rubrinervis]KAF3449724.1 hypothetical protein FNV43_RR10455 [Rhamnella rubrinervis]